MQLITKKVVTYKELEAWDKNPRSAADPAALEELKASIQEKGILDALLVREIVLFEVKTPGDAQRVATQGKTTYRVINGGRRLRVAQELKLDHVPVDVYQLTDQEALEINLAEQIQHQALNPLEEARALARFTAAGSTPDFKALGQKIGKSAAYVRIRMALLRLTPEAQKTFEAGRLPLKAAVNALTLDAKSQEKFLKEMVEMEEEHPGGDPGMDYRARSLRQAPFDLALKTQDPKDPDLTRTCPGCEFQFSGKQPDLFVEVPGMKKDDQLCLYPDCYDARVQAHYRTEIRKLGFAEAPIKMRKNEDFDPRTATKGCPAPQALVTLPTGYSKGRLQVVCGDAGCPRHKKYDDKYDDLKAEHKRMYGGSSKPEDPKKREEQRRRNRAEFLLKGQAFIKACTPQIIRAQALSAVADRMSDDADLDQWTTIETFGKKAISYPPTYHSYPPTYHNWMQFAKDAKTFEESLQKLVLLAAVEPEDNDYFQTDFMDEVLGKKARIDPKAIAAKVKELYPEQPDSLKAVRLKEGEVKDPVQREIDRAFALLELNCTPSIFEKIRAKTKDAKPGALADYLEEAIEAEKKQAKKSGRKWKELAVQPGTCRVCGCTEEAACPGGCSWVDKTKTLCSSCAKPKGKGKKK